MGVSTGIVIPAYRPDRDRLIGYTQKLDAVLDPDAIHVELDCPNSTEVAASIQRDTVSVNVARDRRGKGAAVTAGFNALDTDVRMFLDADGATPASSAAKVLAPLTDGTADLSVGSRRHPDADVQNHQTVIRKFMGDTFAGLSSLMLPISLTDYQCGAKAVTADLWQEVTSHLYESGFAWDLELVAVSDAMGYDVTEVPIAWEDQPGSTVDLAPALIEFARALVTVRHRALSLQGSILHSTLPESRSKALVNTSTQE